jgi:O-antigen/teichoic acid export membrane protein
MSVTTRPLKLISDFLYDGSLTRKAYLNAVTVILDYGAALIVGFIITPLMVTGLGNYTYGLWQVLNRMIGYLMPASGRPGFALKATLANQQASTDYDQKRRYVGSTIVIWFLFLPFLIGLGSVVSWYVPFWLNVPANYVWITRVVAALLVTNIVVDALASVPQVTLQGENLGYKRMGMSVVLVFMGGGFTWLALYLKTGIIGVTTAVVASTLLTGLFYLWVIRSYLPWFGIARPSFEDTRKMLGLSWWFMLWNLVTTFLLASDVVVLGLLNSVASVTNYTLTKYVPETLIGVIVIVIFGVLPGLGKIIGTEDYERAIRLRSEINSFIWLVATTLGASILIWNRVFLGLWVGSSHFSGSLPNLLIVVSSMQLAFIRSDGNIIDLTLRLSQKVLLGLLAVIVSIAAASVMVGYFKWGIVGLCAGTMAGRLIISVGYPSQVGHLLGIKVSSQIRGMIRPAAITLTMFVIAAVLDNLLPTINWSGAQGWLFFILSAALTGILMLIVSFYAGLSTDQRKNMIQRVRAVLTRVES